MSSVISYRSNLHTDYNIHVVYKESPFYTLLKDLFEYMNSTIAVLQIGTTNIFIDGEEIEKDYLTANHLLAIEAHEIAHGILKHAPGYDDQAEREADELGSKILEENGYIEAAKLLRSRVS